MVKEIVDGLENGAGLSKDALAALLLCGDMEEIAYLKARARQAADRVFGKDIYIRGLIEFTNYCKNDCYYCGIRCGNEKAQRYRLTREQILECCRQGYALGFRTFVLQGGEDAYFTEKRVCAIVYDIKSKFADCAVTLSIGEKSRRTYQAYFDAGADRYLLRHETANSAHYAKLHPSQMRLENRKQCLYDLKQIGYQVGAGFAVDGPAYATWQLRGVFDGFIIFSRRGQCAGCDFGFGSCFRMFAVSGERCDSGSLAGLGGGGFSSCTGAGFGGAGNGKIDFKTQHRECHGAVGGKAAVICLAVAVKIAVKSGKHGFTFGAVGDDCADALYKSGIGFLRYGTEVG